MRNESPLNRILKSILEDHIAHIQEEIASIKVQIQNIDEELQALDFMSENDVISKDMFPDVLKQHLNLVKQNRALLTQVQELHKKQEDFTSVLEQTHPSQFSSERQENQSMTRNEELYVLREIRNFYIENDDFTNTQRIAEEINKLRSN